MLHDPSSAFGVTAFAPSEIKQIDQLLEHLEDGTSAAFLLPVFEELDQILGSLYAIYLHELQFLAEDEPQNAAADQIAADFGAVRPLVAALRNELSLNELDLARHTAAELKNTVAKLFASFGLLKDQARQGPRYSELPFTQELLRVVHHYLKGRLALGAVQERLDAFCNYHDHLEASLEQMEPTPAEAPIFEARRGELEDALALQLQGIEDLDVALERRSDRGIRQAVQTLQAAAATLFEIYSELQKAELEPARISCFRCGASNLAEQRLCTGCGAVLPRFDAGVETSKRTPTIEFREAPEGGPPPRPEELCKLELAVDDALRNQDASTLESALAHFETKLRQVAARLAGLKAAPEDLPPEQHRLLLQSRSRFADSLALLQEGHALLAEGSPTLDTGLLRQGLEKVEDGFEVMLSFHELYEQAEQLSAASS